LKVKNLLLEIFFILKGCYFAKKHGFYIIDDTFFEDFPDSFLKGNKTEKKSVFLFLWGSGQCSVINHPSTDGASQTIL